MLGYPLTSSFPVSSSAKNAENALTLFANHWGDYNYMLHRKLAAKLRQTYTANSDLGPGPKFAVMLEIVVFTVISAFFNVFVAPHV